MSSRDVSLSVSSQSNKIPPDFVTQSPEYQLAQETMHSYVQLQQSNFKNARKLASRMQSLSQQISGAKSDAALLQPLQEHLLKKQSEIDQLKEQIEQQELAIGQLEADLLSSQAPHAENQEKIAQLMQSIAEKEKELQAKKTELWKAERTFEAEYKSYEELNRELSSLEDALEAAKRELARAEKENAEAQTELEEAQQEVDEFPDQRTARERALEEALAAEKTGVEKEIQSLKDTCASLDESIKEARAKIAKNAARTDKVRHQYDKLAQRLHSDALEHFPNALVPDHADFLVRLGSLILQPKTTLEEIEALQKANAAFAQSHRQIEEENEKLEDELGQIQRTLIAFLQLQRDATKGDEEALKRVHASMSEAIEAAEEEEFEELAPVEVVQQEVAEPAAQIFQASIEQIESGQAGPYALALGDPAEEPQPLVRLKALYDQLRDSPEDEELQNQAAAAYLPFQETGLFVSIERTADGFTIDPAAQEAALFFARAGKPVTLLCGHVSIQIAPEEQEELQAPSPTEEEESGPVSNLPSPEAELASEDEEEAIQIVPLSLAPFKGLQAGQTVQVGAHQFIVAPSPADDKQDLVRFKELGELIASDESAQTEANIAALEALNEQFQDGLFATIFASGDRFEIDQQLIEAVQFFNGCGKAVSLMAGNVHFEIEANQ